MQISDKMENTFFVWAEGPLIKNSAYIFTLDLDCIDECEFTAFVSAFNFINYIITENCWRSGHREVPKDILEETK